MDLFEDVLKDTYLANGKTVTREYSSSWENHEERLSRLLQIPRERKPKLSNRISRFFQYTLYKDSSAAL